MIITITNMLDITNKIMWKTNQNISNPGFEVCKICGTNYPECGTCRKYGRRDNHPLDNEKQKGAHDNSGFSNDEPKDPRNKTW